MASVGMMDPAYFVGKNELLTWLNDLLKLNYSKVEQCNSGAAYCQIIDAVYPGEVPLKKVNFNAKNEPDYIKNFKVLQSVFDKKQIARHVEVQKLMLPGSSSFIHNLEFLQWIKKYFDTHYGGQQYDAVERRGGASPSVVAKENAPAKPTVSKPATTPNKPRPASASAARVPARDVSNSAAPSAAPGPRSSVNAARAAAAATSAVSIAANQPAQTTENRRLQEEVTSLKFTVEKLESERDFYFGKLREVEIICQKWEGGPTAELVENITKVLYAEDGANPHESAQLTAVETEA